MITLFYHIRVWIFTYNISNLTRFCGSGSQVEGTLSKVLSKIWVKLLVLKCSVHSVILFKSIENNPILSMISIVKFSFNKELKVLLLSPFRPLVCSSSFPLSVAFSLLLSWKPFLSQGRNFLHQLSSGYKARQESSLESGMRNVSLQCENPWFIN